MSRKYQKFGLRADKNLADLSNPISALTNLLDNISVSGDGFIPDDLLIIDGLRNTAISPDDFRELDGRVVTFTRLSDGANLPVTPLLRIQDFISNFQTIFGDPPFIGGGDGFLANFVPSTRVTPTASATTTGNSQAVAVTDKDDLVGTGNLFSTYVPDPAVEPGHPFLRRDIIGPEFFWDRGIFSFDGKLHPTFPDAYGLIQWTGYMSSDFSFVFETTGMFLVEEDTLNDGNWITKKNIYDQTREIPIGNVTVQTAYDGSSTVLNYGDDIRYVASGDVITTNPGGTYDPNTEYTVTAIDEVAQTITVEGDLDFVGGGGGQTILYHYFEVGIQEVRTGIIYITRPRLGQRTKIRLTYWFPRPSELSIRPGETPATDNKVYRSKVLLEDQGNDDRFPFTDVYSIPAGNQTFSQYSYKVFEDVRARPINQDMSEQLDVNGVLLLDYTPPQTAAEKTLGGVSVTHRGFGRLECATAINSDIKEGTWMLIDLGQGSSYVYQVFSVQEDPITGLDIVYVDTDDTNPTFGPFALDGVYDVVFFDNAGLIGLYNYNGSTGSVTQITGGPTPSISVSGDITGTYTPIERNMLVIGYAQTASAGSIVAGSPLGPNATPDPSDVAGAVTMTTPVDTNLPGVSSFGTSTYVVAVYSNAGLKDQTAIIPCEGVLGKELVVASPATFLPSGSSTLTLTDTAGLTNGDYVQFGDAIPAASNVTLTVVNGTDITLSSPTSEDIPTNVTIVFISQSFNPGGQSKEFCVIPLNTAPPFAGTNTGLSTTASNPNLKVGTNSTDTPANVACKLAFSELEIDDPSGSTVTLLGGTTTANNVVPIEYEGATFNLLIQ